MKNFEKTNNFKNELVDYLVSLLDDLKNGTVYSIRSSFIIVTNSKINDVKLVLKEICDHNPDIRGRVDVFDLNIQGKRAEDVLDNLEINHDDIDELSWEMVKGVTILLFLDKDKDRFDYTDINRFYAQYPQFYTVNFEEKYKKYKYNNKFFGDLLNGILAVKEKYKPFHVLTFHSLSMKWNADDPLIKELVSDTRFITDAVIDKAKQEGLKCKKVKLMLNDTDYDEHIFIYKSESEKMNKAIQSLEKVEPNRIGKVIYSHCGPTCWTTLRCNQRK